MSTVANDELTEAVLELRAVFPEMRLGQLVLNLAAAAGASDPGDVWDIEDKALLEAAQRLLARNRGRAEADAQSNAAPDASGPARSPLS